MEKHGSESYFVIGEGLLAESVGGREPAAAAVDQAAPPFRFTRMGPNGAGRQLGEPNRRKIARAMAGGGGGQSDIPAGYTYLDQFIDHDLTFDKTSMTFGQNVSPAALLQGPSPSLDLDSLYGARPQDPESARFYRDDRHFKLGKTAADAGIPAKNGFDLPRGEGNTQAKRRRAVIPDLRNDENLAVVDTLPSTVPPPQRFTVARELVTKHYQWMIRTDFLPRICAAGVVKNVFNQGRKAFEVGATPTEVPTMPIEFSVAAFRLGHAMIRRAYNWNNIFDDGGGTLDLLFTFSATGGPGSPCPRRSSTGPCASTRRWSLRCAPCHAARSAGRACRRATRARTSPSAT